jgi:GTPase
MLGDMQRIPTVLLVGRPNVGKSTLFNRICGQRRAVVSDSAGTTRDVLRVMITGKNGSYMLCDAAGVEQLPSQHSELEEAVQEQFSSELSQASLLIWVVERNELELEDRQFVQKLRKSGHPIVVAVNKCDHAQHDAEAFEFAEFGFSSIVPISGLHGRGVTELQSLIESSVATTTMHEDTELSVAIVGRPNVGKSTLLNTVLGEKRAVVSSEAGTTRDSIDMSFPAQRFFGSTYTKWKSVRMVDTAGIRRRGKIGLDIERWSFLRTHNAIDDAQVVLLVLDALEGMVAQDLQIANLVEQSGKALVVVVNKWDELLIQKNYLWGTPDEAALQEHFLIHLRQTAPFLYWAPVIFLSAKTGMNTEYIARTVLDVATAWSRMSTEEELAAVTAMLRAQPRLSHLQSITQPTSCPPVFHVHLEGKQLPHFSTMRNIDTTLREILEIGPTPIKVWAVPSMVKSRSQRGGKR